MPLRRPGDYMRSLNILNLYHVFTGYITIANSLSKGLVTKFDSNLK